MTIEDFYCDSRGIRDELALSFGVSVASFVLYVRRFRL